MYGTHPLSDPINPCLLHAIARCLATVSCVEVGHMSLPRIATTISTPLKQAHHLRKESNNSLGMAQVVEQQRPTQLPSKMIHGT